MDFDGDENATVPDNNPLGKIINDGIQRIPYDIWEPAQKATKTKFIKDDGTVNTEDFVNYLVKSAKVDRVGIITNYATKAQDIANHLRCAIFLAKENNCSTITLVHPQQWKHDGVGGYVGTLQDGTNSYCIKGLVPVVGKKGDEILYQTENVYFGTYSFEQISQFIEYYSYIVAILRILQGREIDGAKTGVYAEGVSGLDYTDTVKISLAPHAMLLRKQKLGRKIGWNDQINCYHSLSPLGFLADYVQQEVFVKERILTELDNGVNMSSSLYTLLTQEEKAFFNTTWVGQSGQALSLLDIMSERKTVFNTSLRNLSISNEEDAKEMMTVLREQERTDLQTIANFIGAPMEVIAVAAYMVAYNKASHQNSGLGYGWVLMPELLTVFSRMNKQYQLIRLPNKTIETAYVKNGILYVNDKAYIYAKAYNGVTPLRIIDGIPCALIHRKVNMTVSQVNDVAAYDNYVYTIGTNGFKYHIGRGTKATNDELKAMWKGFVKDNNYTFDITKDDDERVVISINGQSISSLIMNKADVSLFGLIGKKVMLVNNKTVNGEKISSLKETEATITDMKVMVIGNAD